MCTQAPYVAHCVWQSDGDILGTLGTSGHAVGRDFSSLTAVASRPKATKSRQWPSPGTVRQSQGRRCRCRWRAVCGWRSRTPAAPQVWRQRPARRLTEPAVHKISATFGPHAQQQCGCRCNSHSCSSVVTVQSHSKANSPSLLHPHAAPWTHLCMRRHRLWPRRADRRGFH